MAKICVYLYIGLFYILIICLEFLKWNYHFSQINLSTYLNFDTECYRLLKKIKIKKKSKVNGMSNAKVLWTELQCCADER